MIFGQWIIIDHHTLPLLRPKRLLQESTYASQDMLLWNLAANVSTYTRILMDIWTAEKHPSVSWGHGGCSGYALSHKVMTNVYKVLQNEISPICYHWASSQRVFNFVRDEEVLSLCQWKMYNQWGPDGNFWAAGLFVSLIDSDLL